VTGAGLGRKQCGEGAWSGCGLEIFGSGQGFSHSCGSG